MAAIPSDSVKGLSAPASPHPGKAGSRRDRVACPGRRLEHREIADAALERRHRGFAIAHRRQFTAQEPGRRAVARGDRVGIDDPDTAAGLHRARKVPQQAEGLVDLVIHVDQHGGIERGRGQARIVRLAAHHGDVGQPLLGHPPLEVGEVIRRDVLSEDAPLRPDAGAEPHHVVAAARADIGDRLPRPDPHQARDLPDLVGPVALLLPRPLRRHDLGDRPIRLRKFFRRLAGRGERLGGGGRHGQQQEGEDGEADHPRTTRGRAERAAPRQAARIRRGAESRPAVQAASARDTVERRSASENGFVSTSVTMASRPRARSRWSAKPVIRRIVRSG